MVNKVYKIGYRWTATVGTNPFKQITQNIEYQINVPFNGSDFQDYQASTKCKITLDYFYLTGTATGTPSFGVEIHCDGKGLENSSMILSPGSKYTSYDIIGHALTVYNVGATTEIASYTSPVNQPDHDFELLTTTGQLTGNMVINIKTIFDTDTFICDATSSLNMALTVTVME